MSLESSFRFPLSETYLILSGEEKGDKREEEKMKGIKDRLKSLCESRFRPSSSLSSPCLTSSSYLIIEPGQKRNSKKEKEGKVTLCSSMKTGMEKEMDKMFYVATRPEEFREKTRQLLLNESALKSASESAPGAEKNVIEGPRLGKKAKKKLRKAEREKTKGKAWFGMGAPELTEETKRDLEVLQMRGAMDPKRFYKKNDHKELPKYFQIGQVVDAPADFYSDRIPNKSRKKSLVGELMADPEFQKYSKRKYSEISEEKLRTGGARARTKAKRKKKAAKKTTTT